MSTTPPSYPASITSNRSRSNTPRTERREERIKAAGAYGLRPRISTTPPETDDGRAGGSATSNKRIGKSSDKSSGRMAKWQTEWLQRIFDTGIRTPGDLTIATLANEMGDRYVSSALPGRRGH